MKSRAGKPLLFILVMCSLLVAVRTIYSQPTPVELAEQAEYKAYSDVKAADTAGANTTSLVDQFNAALSLIEEAKKADAQGNQTGASSLASEAENSFTAISSNAQKAEDSATSGRSSTEVLQIAAVPITALVVALGAVIIAAVRRMVESRQFLEQRIALKSRGAEPNETS